MSPLTAVETKTVAGVRFEPWTDGCSVGFRVVYSDGIVEYMYLTPPVDEKNNAVDLYVGRVGDSNRDRRLYDIKL